MKIVKDALSITQDVIDDKIPYSVHIAQHAPNYDLFVDFQEEIVNNVLLAIFRRVHPLSFQMHIFFVVSDEGAEAFKAKLDNISSTVFAPIYPGQSSEIIDTYTDEEIIMMIVDYDKNYSTTFLNYDFL